MTREYIARQAEMAFEPLRAIRRQLHRYPELATREFKTQQLIMEFLDQEGIPYEKCADTGLVARVEGQPGGRVTALRADIDALPIHESEGTLYRSQHDGVMHACGHDVHTAINMGVAQLLNQNRQSFRGMAKFFFQPAEEAVGGARRMVAEGCMENPRVESVIGLHVMPSYPYNQIEYRYGAVNAAADTLRLVVRGKRGHGAYPDRCVDAVVIAAQVVTALQTAVSRTVSPLNSAVLTLGVIRGGEASNIVADQVELLGTIRSSSPSVRAQMHEAVRAIAEGVAQSLGGACEVVIPPEGYPALINDAGVLDVILAGAEAYLGRDNLREKPAISMGGEDFSYFNAQTPGAFYNLGCKKPDRAEEYFLHTANFDVDERCIVTGVVLQTLAALRLMGN